MTDDKCARCGDQLDPRDRYDIEFVHFKYVGHLGRVQTDRTKLCAVCFEYLRGEVIEVDE